MFTYNYIIDQHHLKQGDQVYAGDIYWYRGSYHGRAMPYRFRVDPVPQVRKPRGGSRWCKGYRLQRWRLDNYVIEDDLTEVLTPHMIEKIRSSSPRSKNSDFRDYWDDLPRDGCRDRSWKFCTKRRHQHKL